MIKRPSFEIFPNIHVFPGGHLEKSDLEISKSKMNALKVCSIRETLEESGVWPLENRINPCGYEKKSFEIFLKTNKITLKAILDSKIYPWFNWKTPNCKEVYPLQWNMQMFVTISSEMYVNLAHKTNEATEIIWMNIYDALNLVKTDRIHLAPPQWFMLNEMAKYPSDAEFLKAVRFSKYPKIIHPRLVGSLNSNIWHSVLYKDKFYNDDKASIYNVNECKGPFHRLVMEKVGEYFQNYKLIEDK